VPFEAHLADAYAALLSGGGKGPARRPELVVLVSHEVAKRGWRTVEQGEVCKIPGIGPVAPEVARAVAKMPSLTGSSMTAKTSASSSAGGATSPSRS
jgi:hypothetical protein